MIVNRKWTAGLAWAGLVLVFAVPSADIISSQFTPQSSSLSITSDTDAVQTASLPADPVERFTTSGKPLPSYISDATAEIPAAPTRNVVPAVTPKPQVIVQAPATEPVDGATPWAPTTQTATIPPAQPPAPMPLSMRPKPQPNAQQPIVLDEQEVLSREAAVPPAEVRQPDPVVVDEPRVIGEDELEGWDSGSLADYLERRGLLDEGSSRARVSDDDDFDPDGFFLDEGPNNDNRRPRRRIFADDDYFIVFPD